MSQPPQPPEGALIASALQASGLSIRKAAAAAGVSEGHLRQVIQGSVSRGRGRYAVVTATARVLAQIAQALDIAPDLLDSVARPDAARELRALADASDVRQAVLSMLDGDPDFRAAIGALPPDLRARALDEVVRLHRRTQEDARRLVETMAEAARRDDP